MGRHIATLFASFLLFGCVPDDRDTIALDGMPGETVDDRDTADVDPGAALQPGAAWDGDELDDRGAFEEGEAVFEGGAPAFGEDETGVPDFDGVWAGVAECSHGLFDLRLDLVQPVDRDRVTGVASLGDQVYDVYGVATWDRLELIEAVTGDAPWRVRVRGRWLDGGTMTAHLKYGPGNCDARLYRD